MVSVMSLILNICIWFSAVAGLPLLLVLIVYTYIEGAPEVVALIARTVRSTLKCFAEGLSELINEIFNIKIIGIIQSVWPYMIYFVIILHLFKGEFDYSYLVAMVGALIEGLVRVTYIQLNWPG